MLTGLGAKTTFNYKKFLQVSNLSAAAVGWCMWYPWYHGGWSRLGRLVWSGCLWEGCWVWPRYPANLPAPGTFSPNSQSSCVAAGMWDCRDECKQCSREGRSRGPRQDTRGEEGSKASRWPCSQSWSCRQMVCMFEKSKPGFLQTCGVPRRALPRQLLAQVMQIGQGVKKWAFHLTPSPNAPSLQCVGWEREPLPDGEKDPKGAGSPGMSAAYPCSQLGTAIWLVPHTTRVQTGNTASFSGHTNNTVV